VIGRLRIWFPAGTLPGSLSQLGFSSLWGRSLSLIPGRGDGSPPRSSPGSSIGILGRFDSGDLAMTPAAPGHVLGSVTPDVLPSRQHHCNVDKWLSLDVR